jgi:hypothetical protein
MRGKRDARARVRGSGMARLTGAGLAILLAGVGVAAYLIVGGSHARPDASELPAKVLGTQAVGLVNPGPAPSGADPQMLLLLATRDGLSFTSAGQVGANWTADQMSGGTYIFIYLPNGLCLGSARGTPAALQRCSLQANQRWAPERQVTGANGVDYSQLRNLSDGRCLTAVAAAGAASSAPTTARLERCQAAPDWHQLIAFVTAS